MNRKMKRNILKQRFYDYIFSISLLIHVKFINIYISGVMRNKIITIYLFSSYLPSQLYMWGGKGVLEVQMNHLINKNFEVSISNACM